MTTHNPRTPAPPAGRRPVTEADAQVAREEISRHYTDRIEQIRTELAETTQRLSQQLAQAETARRVWQDHGQITPATGNTTDPDMLAMGTAVETALIRSRAEQAIIAAWKATRANPHNPELRAAYDQAHQRAQTLNRWLDATGHDWGIPDTDGW